MNTPARPITAPLVRSLIPPRRADSDKYDYGHVMVVAGSPGMEGAAALCSFAALRAGAGLVTACVPASAYATAVPRLRPEIMALPLPSRLGVLVPRAVQAIRAYARLRRVTVMVIGPGIGRAAATVRFVETLLGSIDLPVILDADALHAVASSSNVRGAIRARRQPTIMTPHPGEMARILSLSPQDVHADRQAAVVSCARTCGAVSVLKGHRTLVASEADVWVNTTGNPGMATAGSGDVLAGVIAGLYAQIKEPRSWGAAVAGVFLHGRAGDGAARARTMPGMVAGDIIENIPASFRGICR